MKNAVIRFVSLFLLAGSILLSSGCSSTLFNGSDLSGWQIKCAPGDKGKLAWTVQDGVIVGNSTQSKKHDYLWLMTDKEYSDFILKLKFQPVRGATGNSGIQIRSRYDEQSNWLNGPQIDIHPKQPWRTGMMWDETYNNKRWIFPDLPKKKWVNKDMALNEFEFYYDDDNKWNEMVITAKGTQITATLNGVLITDYDGAGVLDDEYHQSCKVGIKGYIALQIHKNNAVNIKFKDIEIIEK